ncbi:DUF4190 domain-containing protein [Gracilibacillus alcaliphilus]|uniref:DUF4190 domain-containing protein n=1 Tax=Gracilibacillus alcaliphilus TaxID=1401441 RepID=UPI00195A94B9|nr:DUF4190 domain-containing protein [Gracilibacillus alcaliphilus]MBM7675008.1 hypothetical protein [Gracilibacillus alcaliphilus]
MSNREQDHQVQDAPKLDNGRIESDRSSTQFTDTEELYAIHRANNRDEETAAELSTADFNRDVEEAEQGTQMQRQVNMTYGWIGLVLAVVSFFIWPLVMGIAGIVFGIISKKKGADTLGNAAITVSILSLLITLIFNTF